MKTSYAPNRVRARVEGSVLVEALIAMVMITVLFAAICFFHSLHVRKGEALRTARYQAWVATRPGCNGSIRGRHASVLAIPVQMRTERVTRRELSVGAATEMVCNEVPNPEDDVLSALEWATSIRPDALLAPAVEAVVQALPGGG